jgi:hypothetical protein
MRTCQDDWGRIPSQALETWMSSSPLCFFYQRIIKEVLSVRFNISILSSFLTEFSQMWEVNSVIAPVIQIWKQMRNVVICVMPRRV